MGQHLNETKYDFPFGRSSKLASKPSEMDFYQYIYFFSQKTFLFQLTYANLFFQKKTKKQKIEEDIYFAGGYEKN